MNVALDERWSRFVTDLVRDGRYASESDVVREGLQLVEERQSKTAELREHLQRAIAKGGENSEEDIDLALEAVEADLRREGVID